MIDFTHTKRPDFIQLVLIMAVICLALGALIPAASAVEYEDLTYSSTIETTASFTFDLNQVHSIPGVLFDGSGLTYRLWPIYDSSTWGGHQASLSELITNPGIYTDFPFVETRAKNYYRFWVAGLDVTPTEADVYVRSIADFLENHTDLPTMDYYVSSNSEIVILYAPVSNHGGNYHYWYDLSSESLDISLQAFAPDNPSGMYVLSLDGSIIDSTTYSVGINRYTSEFEYLIDSYAYTDGSGSYIFTGSRSLTLPIFHNSFTNMPYSYEVSVNVNDENGYIDTRYLVYWSDLGGLYDTVPGPLVPTPTPTQTFVPPGPVIPSDIIPDPELLDNTVNITGWYQDMGFEGNNITAPIYSGLRGWFNENLVPVIDFFLTPTNYVATVISDSAETSTDGISYITEELGSYASPFNIVGGYVVLLVPEVVWVVVFAALSIGYVVLLIRVSTGSIKDTIGRFLGGK